MLTRLRRLARRCLCVRFVWWLWQAPEACVRRGRAVSEVHVKGDAFAIRYAIWWGIVIIAGILVAHFIPRR